MAAGVLSALVTAMVVGLSQPSGALVARPADTPTATFSPSGAPGTGGGKGPGSSVTLAVLGACVVAGGGGLVAFAGLRRRRGAA